MEQHPEYSSAQINQPPGAGYRSTTIPSACWYPQDNLSLLLQAANFQTNAPSCLPTSQILRSNLATRFAHNKLSTNKKAASKSSNKALQASEIKNETEQSLEKIYHQQNVRNFLNAVSSNQS